MVSFTYTVQSAQGLHARPVVEVAKVAGSCRSAVTVAKGDLAADAADLMGLLALDARHGDELTVTVEGPDELRVADALRAVFTF